RPHPGRACPTPPRRRACGPGPWGPRRPPPRGAAPRRAPSHGLALGRPCHVPRLIRAPPRSPADPVPRGRDELDQPNDGRQGRELAPDPLERALGREQIGRASCRGGGWVEGGGGG